MFKKEGNMWQHLEDLYDPYEDPEDTTPGQLRETPISRNECVREIPNTSKE